MGLSPPRKLEELRAVLHAKARASPGQRFHALYDRISRRDVLEEAWKRVKRNKGAAGVDAETIASIRALGEESFLNDLSKTLRAGRYRPQAVRRHWIPKANGGRRPLGIPTVRDRVVQTAAKLILEPIFEADFKDCSYGFRPGRSATEALEAIRLRGAGRKGNFVLDNGVLNFRGLTFTVTGAQVALDGKYGLRKEDLDFYGKLRMHAKISQTTTGAKSFVLKAVDPFFRKNGQTEVPFKITGQRDHPSFGLDLHHKK